MVGIVGIDRPDQRDLVALMLNKITHRGKAGKLKLIESRSATVGAVQAMTLSISFTGQQAVWEGQASLAPDGPSVERAREPFACAVTRPGSVFLARDRIGVRPLYYGHTDNGALCFASEVKALLEATPDVHEFPPGTWYDSLQGFHDFAPLESNEPLQADAPSVAAGLRQRLEQSVLHCIDDDVMGGWLSGGLDSSAIAALARPHVRTLHTFAGGVSDAPDLDYARQVARFLGTEHHQIIVTFDELLQALPEVIYHLESFDALLVRSTLMNYLVSQYAADYVGEVLSGEGSDELFAGYHYLKELAPDQLPQELAELVRRLHNTALQRVDRSASAHGLIAHVPFLDLDVVEFSQRIPPQFKLWRNGELIEKWILRQALAGALPDVVLWRSKAKFWEGAGVGDLLAQHAQERISDRDLRQERILPNGWTLNTKEELLYYRLFRGHFGPVRDLSWMGRTKGAPKQP